MRPLYSRVCRAVNGSVASMRSLSTLLIVPDNPTNNKQQQQQPWGVPVTPSHQPLPSSSSSSSTSSLLAIPLPRPTLRSSPSSVVVVVVCMCVVVCGGSLLCCGWLADGRPSSRSGGWLVVACPGCPDARWCGHGGLSRTARSIAWRCGCPPATRNPLACREPGGQVIVIT